MGVIPRKPVKRVLPYFLFFPLCILSRPWVLSVFFSSGKNTHQYVRTKMEVPGCPFKGTNTSIYVRVQITVFKARSTNNNKKRKQQQLTDAWREKPSAGGERHRMKCNRQSVGRYENNFQKIFARGDPETVRVANQGLYQFFNNKIVDRWPLKVLQRSTQEASQQCTRHLK